MDCFHDQLFRGLLYLLLLSLEGLRLACSRDLFISWQGRDQSNCGTAQYPCETVHWTIEIASEKDTLYIDGGNLDHVYEECALKDADNHVKIDKTLDFEGFNGIPNIGCSQSSKSEIKHVIFSVEFYKLIRMTHIRLINGIILMTNSFLKIDHSFFHNAYLTTVNTCQTIDVTIANSFFTKSTNCSLGEHCQKVKDNDLVCQKIKFNLQNTSMLDTKVLIEAMYSADIVATENLFTQTLPSDTGIAGLNVTIPYNRGSVRVTKSIFENQKHHDPIFSSINIEAAALRIQSMHYGQGQGLDAPQAVLVIHDCIFRNNERALSISSPFRSVIISNCSFQDNLCMHAASAIRLALSNTSKVYIKDTEFIDNQAGYTSHLTQPRRFEIYENEVHLNSVNYKGVVSLVGKGGAIRLQRGHLDLERCKFINNSASLLGGAIFVDRPGEINITSCQFENTNIQRHSLQGDILYSSGKVTIKDSNFTVKDANEHVTVLRHSGDHWSMEVFSILFKCPVGHRLSLVNTTSHRIRQGVGLMRSHKLDQLSYYCQTCRNNQYSLDRGYLKYTLRDNTTEYYTLYINGSSPFESHSVDFIYGNISCQNCPYGGDCDRGISSLPNFYGFPSSHKSVSFQHCPPDYCCSKVKCHSINSCEDHRMGTLCGRCEDGYSEALFSSQCVPNKHCHISWMYVLVTGMVIVYCLFLVFQKDIKDFIANWPSDETVLSWENRAVLTWFWKLKNTQKKKKYEKEDAMLTENDPEMPLDNYEMEEMSNGVNSMEEEIHRVPVVVVPNKKQGDSGFLIIMFYYFQDALLLHIHTIYTRSQSKVEKQVKSLLLGLLRFRIEFYHFLTAICLFPDTTPVLKTMLKALIVPYMLIIFGCLYAMKGLIFAYLSRKSNKEKTDNKSFKYKKLLETFSTRLAGGFILALLFTYQKLATTTFTLLNCVPVANESVLFMDGNVTCFESWQYVVMFYAFLCVLPFSIILLLGPVMLKQEYISLRQFFFGCLLPLPASVHWFWILARGTLRDAHESNNSPEKDMVLKILQGPFKEPTKTKIWNQLCWAGVLIGRRMILFMCYTFINSVLIRILCMLVVCFVSLLHHMYTQPYKYRRGNIAGSLSAAALLTVGGINLLRGCFEAAEYVPQGPIKVLMLFCDEIENILVLWLPLVGMCIVILALFVKILLFSANMCLKNSSPKRHDL